MTNMRRYLLLCLLAVVVISSAAALAQTSRPGRAPASATVSFAETIAPIVYANCVTCHRQIGRAHV